MKKIIILYNQVYRMPDDYVSQVRNMASDYEVIVVRQDKLTDEMLEGAEVITGHPDAGRLVRANQLRWLHIQSAGVDKYADPALLPSEDVIVTRTAGVFGTPIAEHVVGMMIALCRAFPVYDANQRNRQWKRLPEGNYRQISGATVLVVGAGDLGGEIAKRLSGFDCRILGVRRSAQPSRYFDDVYGMAELPQALGKADFTVIALPSTKETRGMFDAELLASMKRDSILINIGRGDIVDTAALAAALQSGWLGGAGLDVTDPETLTETSPIWMLDNVMITPHVSGFSPKIPAKRAKLFLDLLSRYLAGQELYNRVDYTKGY